MKSILARAVLLAPLILLPALPVTAATPAPKHPTVVPTPRVPTVPLHTDFVVEVNKKGQVVRVKKGKSCPNLTFNAQTYGNVLQMWIRHPDGTAEVGLYKVDYDYNPQTRKVKRGVALLQRGGNWGDEQGAADQMIDIANRQAAKSQQQAQQRQDQQQKANLPPLDLIVGSPSPHP